MAYKLLTAADSPYTIGLQQGSAALGAESLNLDVIGAVTIIFPAIAGITPSTLNQKITVTNVDATSHPTFQPAGADAFSGSGTGIALVGPSGLGSSCVRRFQPASAGVAGVNATWSVASC